MIGLTVEIRCDEPDCAAVFVLTSPVRPTITVDQFAADHHFAYRLAVAEGWQRASVHGRTRCPEHVAELAAA